MKKTIAIVLMTLAVPAAANAWTSCLYHEGDPHFCERQWEMESRLDEVRNRQEQMEHELQWAEQQARDAASQTRANAEADAYRRGR